MKNSRTYKALLTFIASILTKISQYGINFFVTPVMIQVLGATDYGVWQIINQFINYISFADLRPTNALKYIIASKQSVDDKSFKRRQVGSALIAWLITLPILILTGCVIAYFLPVTTKVDVEKFPLVRLIGLILLLDYLLGNLSSLVQSILRGENLAYKGIIFISTTTLLSGIVMIIVVRRGYGLLGVAIVTVLTTCIFGVGNWWITKKNVKWLGIEKPSWEEVKKLIRFGFWILLSSFSGMLLFSTDIMIIGLSLGARFVTTYVITKTVIELINNLVYSLVSSSLAGLGDLYGRGDFSRLREVRASMQLFTFFCISVIGAGVISLNKSFVGLWVGGQQYAGNIVNLILVIASFEPLLNQQDSLIIDLTQEIASKMLVTLLSGVAAVTCGFLLIPSLGILGMAIGNLLGRFLYLVGLSLLCAVKIDESITVYFKRLIRPIIASCLLYWVAFQISERFTINTWWLFLMVSILLGLIFALTAWFCELNKLQRTNISQYLYFCPTSIRNLLSR